MKQIFSLKINIVRNKLIRTQSTKLNGNSTITSDNCIDTMDFFMKTLLK